MDTRSRFEAFLNYLIFILGKGREFGLVELSSSASAILKPKKCKNGFSLFLWIDAALPKPFSLDVLPPLLQKYL